MNDILSVKIIMAEAYPGARIFDVCREAIKLASAPNNGCIVRFKFNNIAMEAKQDSDTEQLVQQYSGKLTRLKAYQDGIVELTEFPEVTADV